MFIHYLKIAFRNMRKYFNQTLISIVGLAVGFTCFALATLWIRYEITFDRFHKNAKHKYVVYRPDTRNQTGYNSWTAYALATYLKETFPEIADAIPLSPPNRNTIVIVEGERIPALTISADTSFFRMFDIKILEGSRDFLIPGSNKRAITREKALQLFGDEHPIGKTINDGRNEICAIVSGMAKRSNYAFDFISPFPPHVTNQMWTSGSGGVNTIIELFPGMNIKDFEKKLYEHETGVERGNISKLSIKPITKIHYLDQNIAREVKFQHILIFALSGLLVILCSLFNYLTLFISRFRIRQKELALRMVCGASGRSLLAMLSVEFILTLLFAVLLGCCLTQLAHGDFLTLSNIQMNLPAIYSESLMYIGGVILISLLVFWLILFIFQRMSLNMSIRRTNKKLFRKISVVVQLMISIGFAFCTIIILKQMYFLHHSGELGFSFKNRGSVIVENGDGFADRLKQIPEITEVVDARRLSNLLPQTGRSSLEISSWDEKPFDAENISLEQMFVSPEYITFYDFRLLLGEMLTDADPESSVLLNEVAVKAFGWHDPVGKRFDDKYTVKGVIRHVYNFAPTIPAKPVFYIKPPPNRETMVSVYYDADGERRTYSRLVLFKYHEGMWKACKEKIELLKDEFKMADLTGGSSIYSAEEIYDDYLKSENNLIKFLSFVSAICVLICVFGFVSLVSLTCEERRKSIAIRKINGATAGDILAMFAKEYFLLLIIGTVIAFTTGFFIMQRWLENYVKQTSIPAWIYLSIIFALALVIVLCVGWQVYKSSIENPAEVVKSE